MKRYKSTFKETYHLINKGMNSMVIFRNEEDKSFFCYLINLHAQKNAITIIAYALMDNHYHLCVRSDKLDFKDISKFMKGVNSSYVRYFNKTDGTDDDGNLRSGSIYHSTYKSVPVNSEFQLKCLVRYIHNNPASIKDVKIETYKWSSYKRYLDVLGGRVSQEKDNNNNAIQLDMSCCIGLTEQEFISITKEGKNDKFAEFDGPYRGKYFMSDPLLAGEVEFQYGIKPSKIRTLEHLEQGMYLFMIAQIRGTSKKQIARITGMNYSQVCRIIKEYKKKHVQITEIKQIIIQAFRENVLRI